MKRTQIQIPDALYEKLKKLAKKEETSLAEIIRRAGEYLLYLYPEFDKSAGEWSLPVPEDLGPFLKDDDEWREIANDPGGE